MTQENPAPTKPVAAESTAPRAGAPREFIWALGLAGGFMAFVAWDQSHWWQAKEDYSFGWLVPLFVAYMIYDRWPQVLRRLSEAQKGVAGARWARLVLNGLAILALVVGALFFLLGAFYRAGAGSSQPGTLALTCGMVAVVLPLIFLNVPVSAEPANSSRWRLADLWHEPRWRVAALFLFPVLIWLISAPLVSALESRVSLFLLHKVVTVVSFFFEMLGFPLEQQGNVLVLPMVQPGVPNRVGVADACSGIRSLTACLFAGSFLGAAFFDKLWKKIFLVVASMVFAFIMNLARGLFLTAWAYNYGSDAISGSVHDIAGFAVLGITCLGLMLLVPLLNLRVEWVASVSRGAQKPQGISKS